MKGFFDKTKIQTGGCGTTCKLDRGCQTPRMPVGGASEHLMVVGAAPGPGDNKTEVHWAGNEGAILQEALRQKTGIRLYEDCWHASAVACRPRDDRPPSAVEIDACRPRLIASIREKQPTVVLLLGDAAVDSVIGNTWKEATGGIARWRGFTIPDQDLGCWLCPTWHPAFHTRGEPGDVADIIWRQDLERAVDLTLPDAASFPNLKNLDTKIWTTKDRKVVGKSLDTMMAGRSPVAFDYETTGLKPDRRGHEIVAVGVSSGYTAFSFPLEVAREEWTNFLRSTVPKWAFNMKFEERWSRGILETEVEGWDWDGMIGAHVQDNRKGICSLAFQAYTNFGVTWKDETQPYMKAETANGFNRVKECPIDKLLERVALDAHLTWMLAEKQKKELEGR